MRGIAAVSACNLLFLVNDTMVKLASDELPLGEMLFIRGLVITLLLLPIAFFSGAFRHTRLIWNWPMFWRTVAEVLSSLLFLFALFRMPFANANAILQVIPLMVTAFAAIFLGAAVGPKRWLAIGIGFAGVLIVIRPGLEGFNVYSLVALAAVTCIALRDIATRLMPRALPALLVALVTATAVCLTGPVLGLVAAEQWSPPSDRGLALLTSAAVCLIGGYVTAVWYMRHGDIAVIAPFRYTAMLWAILVGFLVWGEVPDLPMLIGTAIIILTGIYTLHRERRLARLVAESDLDR
ncbi:MAG: DMT family transporter [Hyphomicrobiales bacterium]|nr:DMT family transporter [Hyphomicrobiales bacterium]